MQSPTDRSPITVLTHKKPMFGTALQEQAVTSQTEAVLPIKGERGLQDCRRQANGGQLEDALQMIEALIERDRLNPDNHFLHGVILQELQLTDKAIKALRRTLYLDSNHVLVYFTLGNIELQREQTTAAKHHFICALSLLEERDPESELTDGDGLTAGQLAEIIRELINRI